MFSDFNDTIVNYHEGTYFNVPERNSNMSAEYRESSEENLARFMTVRSNCSTACSKKLLSELPEEEQLNYVENAKVAQNNLKTFNDELSNNFESCIRSCFVKRVNEHLGGDKQDYVYLTAFEYQQNDFHFFRLNNVFVQDRVRNVKMI